MYRKRTFRETWRTIVIRPFALVFIVLASFSSHAIAPNHVQLELEGCRFGDGVIIADDIDPSIPTCINDAFTKGNLQSGWNELDLVPHRLITSLGTQAAATTTYDVVVSGDTLKGGFPGYDVITPPHVYPGSDASCQVTVGPQYFQPGGGGGGPDGFVARPLKITQAKGTTCEFRWTNRLALGSSQYPGSSLHANLYNENFGTQGVGAKDVSIPVNEILPQELSKNMSADQDSALVWNLKKTANPADLDFGDTCSSENDLYDDTLIRIDWEIVETTPGQLDIITNIYAVNPARRTITIEGKDEIYGTSSTGEDLLTTVLFGPTEVPPNSEETLIATHEIPINSAKTYTSVRDVATATYIDKATGIEVPGDTTAEASADVMTGDVDNQSVYITDHEWIDGSNLSFAVMNVSGANGSFDGGYVLGDKVTELDWTSDLQTSDDYVEFEKRIYLSEPTIVEGKLSDTAKIFNQQDEELAKVTKSVDIMAGATVELTIYKSLSEDVLQAGESATFNFDVKSGGDVKASTSIMLNGTDSGNVTVSGLAPGSYDVLELATTGFTTAVNPKSVAINLPSCVGEVSFVNKPMEPKVKVKKITYPLGNESDWEFSLWKGETKLETGTTDENGQLKFNTELDEGTYEVRETLKNHWKQTDVIDPRNDNSDKVCNFTVDLPDDYNGVKDGYFTCTFENTQDAKVLIRKVVKGPSYLDPKGTFNFEGDLDSFAISTTAFDTPVDSPNGYVYITPRTEPYLVKELDPSGSLFSFTGVSCTDSVVSNSGQVDATPVAAIRVEPGEEVVCTFVNTKEAAPGRVVIRKITKGGIGEFDFESDLNDFSLTTLQQDVAVEKVFEGVEAGLYNVKELDAFDSADGFDLINLQCDDPKEEDGNTTDWNGVPWNGTSTGANISVDDGETVTCTFTNRKRGRIIVDKIANPSDTGQIFKFGSTYAGEFLLKHGEENDSGWLEPGKYGVKELVPEGWDLTKVMCRPDVDDVSAQLVPEVPNPNAVFVNLNAGDVIRCTFTNVERGMVDVVKTLSGNPLGDGDEFTFEIRLGDGTGPAIASATATGPLGAGEAVDFSCTAESFYCMTVGSMAKLPIRKDGEAIQYAFCETGMEPGWQNVEVDEFGTPLVPQNWFVPGGGDPDADNSVECIAFTLKPGETTRFYIDDVPPPGGDARTIGYWKNWTSCDGRGNQDPVMDMNLPITLYEGFTVGTLPLGKESDAQCAIAVDLLDKRHVGIEDEVRDSDKRANDAAYGLAAQYVAYLLNKNAGAYVCAKAVDAATETAYLLDEINFNGQGSYLPSGKKDSDLNLSPKDYKELQDLARELAGILDEYNNNQCH